MSVFFFIENESCRGRERRTLFFFMFFFLFFHFRLRPTAEAPLCFAVFNVWESFFVFFVFYCFFMYRPLEGIEGLRVSIFDIFFPFVFVFQSLTEFLSLK